VLDQLRIAGAPVRTLPMLRQALRFLELIRSLEEVGAGCRLLRIPEARNVPSVARLNRELNRVAEAARAAQMLRNEVLFIPDSPVGMPDLATVDQVAQAIVHGGGGAAIGRAKAELAALADELAAAASDTRAAPEVAPVLDALRALDLPRYVAASARLAAARREQTDQRRLAGLLGRLRAAAPALADIWESPNQAHHTFGTVRFIPLDELLTRLPAEDTADLVVLLDAGSLGPAHLVAGAAAPRLLAVSDDADAAADNSVLGMLRAAGVPVLTTLQPLASPWVRAAGPPVVVPLAPGPSVPPPVAPAPPVPAQRAPSDSPTAPTPPVPAQRGAPPEEEDDAVYEVLPLGIVRVSPGAKILGGRRHEEEHRAGV
jgi:hypothetical protein